MWYSLLPTFMHNNYVFNLPYAQTLKTENIKIILASDTDQPDTLKSDTNQLDTC